jgi:hypothetical protein
MIPSRKITTINEMIELILSIPMSVRNDTEICLEILRKGYHPDSVHVIDAALEHTRINAVYGIERAA